MNSLEIPLNFLLYFVFFWLRVPVAPASPVPIIESFQLLSYSLTHSHFCSPILPISHSLTLHPPLSRTLSRSLSLSPAPVIVCVPFLLIALVSCSLSFVRPFPLNGNAFQDSHQGSLPTIVCVCPCHRIGGCVFGCVCVCVHFDIFTVMQSSC